MSASAGPVLFSCISRTGQLNPILAIAAELSRRAVPDLWFASYVDSRSKIEAASTRIQINFIPLDPKNPTGIKWDESDLEMMMQCGPMSTDGIMALLKKIIKTSPEWRVSVYRNMLDVIDRIQPKSYGHRYSESILDGRGDDPGCAVCRNGAGFAELRSPIALGLS